MNWMAVIEALEQTSRGAERAARAAECDAHRLEARIVSGVAASFACALRDGITTQPAPGADE